MGDLCTKKLEKYGTFNTYDLFKNIAFFAMVIDHIGYYFLPYNQLLRLVGRVSMLIFAVLYGISYKSNKSPHTILFFALITAIPMTFLEDMPLPLNCLFNFYISWFLVDGFENIYKNNYVLFCIFLVLMIPAAFLSNIIIEYGVSFVALMFCGKIFAKEKKTRRDILTTMIIFVLYTVYQSLNFGFNLYYMDVLLIVNSIIYAFMLDFKIRPIKNFIGNNILSLISRTTLGLYTTHITIMIIVKKWLF
ncbi:MAG: conjugal transfer protein TraX [Rickettsiales bacterium]|jgi:hypothetical protein|nr:conjugal transfer protein TraX [Rickettsiales bacterium]